MSIWSTSASRMLRLQACTLLIWCSSAPRALGELDKPSTNRAASLEIHFALEGGEELILTVRVPSILLRTEPRGLQASHSLPLSSSADRTWAYSFSGALLFSMGFLVGLLCYLGYKYVTKPPVPPNSLVSIPPGAREGYLGETLQGPEDRGGP